MERNSALNENGTFKSNVWYDVLGEQYIEIAVSFGKSFCGDR